MATFLATKWLQCVSNMSNFEKITSNIGLTLWHHFWNWHVPNHSALVVSYAWPRNVPCQRTAHRVSSKRALHWRGQEEAASGKGRDPTQPFKKPAKFKHDPLCVGNKKHFRNIFRSFEDTPLSGELLLLSWQKFEQTLTSYFMQAYYSSKCHFCVQFIGDTAVMLTSYTTGIIRAFQLCSPHLLYCYR